MLYLRIEIQEDTECWFVSAVSLEVNGENRIDIRYKTC